jgi:hypothetical protein
VAKIEGRLRSQHKLLGKIVEVMCPPLFGCRTNAELCRVRGWDKNLPSRLLGALPKRSWIKRLRRLGLDVLVPLWRYAANKSAATRSRWQWPWVGDDSVFKKYGEQLGLVGTWWSSQEHRVPLGIDGVLLVVVIGEGKLVVPVDFAIRRPDPTAPGAPCRESPQVPGVRYVQLPATSPTYGAVTIVIVNEPGADQYYVMCLETTLSAPRLIRAWKRRHWIEHCFRTLKHLLATGVCQVHSEDAYYGHLVLRLMGCLVLFYTSRVVCKGRLTMEEIIFSLKHYWRFVDCEALELTALS